VRRACAAPRVLWVCRAGSGGMPPGHPLHGCGQVGQALAKVLEDGVVTRDQLFVTSKLW